MSAPRTASARRSSCSPRSRHVLRRKPRRLAQIALIALLIVGCVAVLLPMVGAILFAFVLWICTWTLLFAKNCCRESAGETLGASLMTLLLVLLMLVPMIFLVGSLANSADFLVEEIPPAHRAGLAGRAARVPEQPADGR
jgi:predicted PurR-regulated permease PerM